MIFRFVGIAVLIFHEVLTWDSVNVNEGGVCTYQTTKERLGWKTKVEIYTKRKCNWSYCWEDSTPVTVREWGIIDPEIVEFSHCCSGYEIQSETPLTCTPTCKPDCVNGTCVSPGQCKCNQHFERAELPYICKPTCDPPCIHGTCTSINECSCNDGYNKSENELSKNVCKPICDTPCTNGECSLPNICKCNEGYTLEGNNSCTPICSRECLNGKCNEPERCICDEGYIETEIWNTCAPYCNDSCINGFCEYPDSCTCFKNYQKQLINDSYCEPICNKVCNNGTCISPDTCQCEIGFEPLNGDNSNCVPHCYTGCDNGNCIAPDVCSCFDGFSYEDNSCLPFCSENCINSNCIAPNECSCQPGMMRFNSNECVPTCKHPDEEECWKTSDDIFPEAVQRSYNHSLTIISENSIFINNMDCSDIFNQNFLACNHETCNKCTTAFICYTMLCNGSSDLCTTCRNEEISMEEIYLNEIIDNSAKDINNSTESPIDQLLDFHLKFFFLQQNSSKYGQGCQMCRCPTENKLTLNGRTTLYFYPCTVALKQLHISSEGTKSLHNYMIVISLILAFVILVVSVVTAVIRLKHNFSGRNYSVEENEPVQTAESEEETSLVS